MKPAGFDSAGTPSAGSTTAKMFMRVQPMSRMRGASGSSPGRRHSGRCSGHTSIMGPCLRKPAGHGAGSPAGARTPRGRFAPATGGRCGAGQVARARRQACAGRQPTPARHGFQQRGPVRERGRSRPARAAARRCGAGRRPEPGHGDHPGSMDSSIDLYVRADARACEGRSAEGGPGRRDDPGNVGGRAGRRRTPGTGAEFSRTANGAGDSGRGGPGSGPGRSRDSAP